MADLNNTSTELKKADPTAMRVVDTSKQEIKPVDSVKAEEKVATPAPAATAGEPKKEEAPAEKKSRKTAGSTAKKTTKTASKTTAEKKTSTRGRKAADEKKEPAKRGRKPAAEKKESAKRGTKTAAKKAASSAKRTPAAPKKAPARIILQYGDINIDHETLMQNVKNYLQYDKGFAEKDMKNMEVYIKPEEGRAYVVVAGEEQGSLML